MEKKEKKWREWIESLAAIYKVSDHIHATEKVSKRILILKVRCEVRNQRWKTNYLSNKKKIKFRANMHSFDLQISSLSPWSHSFQSQYPVSRLPKWSGSIPIYWKLMLVMFNLWSEQKTW
jgi:hypothetical protein